MHLWSAIDANMDPWLLPLHHHSMFLALCASSHPALHCYLRVPRNWVTQYELGEQHGVSVMNMANMASMATVARKKVKRDEHVFQVQQSTVEEG